MDTQLTLQHERVDDIPLIVAMAQRIGIPEVLDRHLGNHGLQAGATNGWLATMWLAHILSAGDHHKSTLRAWIGNRRHLLERMTGQELGAAEGNDDRLGRLLRRLSDDEAWAEIEAELWQGAVVVLALEGERVSRVRLDSTTAYGYHAPSEDGLMRLGHSKDHRPELAQLKLMAAVAEPIRQMVAANVLPGHRADDGLYLPLIRRVRSILGQRGLLYVGDTKMAAKTTRAAIVSEGDHYLTVLPKRAWNDEVRAWLEEARASGSGCIERGRQVQAKVGRRTVRWEERVILHRSEEQARRLNRQLDERLAQAREEILGLTPEPGPGKRQHRRVDTLCRAIGQIERRHGVAGLLWVTWRREAYPSRADPERTRLVVTDVVEQTGAVEQCRAAYGWRILVTDMAADQLPAEGAVHVYHQAWTIERQFYNLKDRPLGIQPLAVSREDQIIGLTRLLILALRLLTLIEVKARRALARSRQRLAGLYDGQPRRTTDRPTGRRLLQAFHRRQLTLTHIRGPTGSMRHITPLTPLLRSILGLLDLPETIYTNLATEPAQ